MKRFIASLASSVLLLMLVPMTTQAVGTNGNYLLNTARSPRLIGDGARLSRNATLAWKYRKSYARVSSLYANELARFTSNPPSLTVTGSNGNDEAKSVVRPSKRSLREMILPGFGQ